MNKQGWLNCRYCEKKVLIANVEKYPRNGKHGSRQFFCSNECNEKASQIRNEMNSTVGLGAIFRCTKYEPIIVNATYRDFADWLKAHFALSYSDYEPFWTKPRDFIVSQDVALETHFSYHILGPQKVVWKIKLQSPRQLSVRPISTSICFSYLISIQPTLERIDEQILFLMESMKREFHWTYKEPEGTNREAWFNYRLKSEQAGIEIPTHAYVGSKIHLAEGTTRNYYNEWKAGFLIE